ncbi:MAG: MlaD family protein [Rhodospirillales bacterium]|nr:MlaD family protein [Rhodospirillales bacterium]
MATDGKEIIVGGVAMVGLVLLFALSYGGRKLSAEGAGGDYSVLAAFNRIDGLFEGDDVRLGGIRIGAVGALSLDENYRAVVSLEITKDVKLPTDSSAAIHTDGLFGNKYIVLEPGGEEAFFQPGETITFTQDSMIVGELLELIISQGKAWKKERREKTGSNPPAAVEK